MDFELDDHAAALLEAAGAALDAEATPALIRAAWSAQDGREQVRKVWATLADLGVVGALVPEDAGGLGLDIGQVVPLLERTGYVGLPVPAVETIAFTAPLLAAAGHPALTDVLAGRCLVTVSAADGRQVPYGQQADLIVLPTAASGPRTPVTSGWGSGPRERSGWGGKVPDTGWGGQSGWGGQPGWTTRPARHPAPGLRVVPAAELALEPVAAVDGARSLARVTQAPPAAAGSTLTSDPATADAAWWRAVVGTSAVLVGLAARMVALTVDHVRGREQFGKPVGSFQAVKHALANAHVAVEFARPAVLAAGWRLAHDDAAPASVAGPESAQDTASVAKVLAADAARLAARTAIQCHGAIGYTTEYDLHLFAKRAWALIPAYGDPTWHRARLAGSLGLAEEPAEPAGSPDRPNAALA